MLSNRFSNYFSSNARSQGHVYYVKGSVQDIELAGGSINAIVQGTFPYQTRLEWAESEEELETSCTCPHFADGFFCKHLWATLLAVEEQMRLTPELSAEFLVFFETASNIVLSHTLPRDSGSREGAFRRPPRRTAQPERAERQRFVSWRHQIDRIDQDTAAIQSQSHFESDPNLTLEIGSEICYQLVLTHTFVPSPVIKFHKRALTRAGVPGRLKALKFSDAQIENFPPEDKKVLAMMIGSRPTMEYTPNVSHQPLYVGTTLSRLNQDVILERLCALNRIGWSPDANKQPNELNLLGWDLGAPWKFELYFEEVEEKGWKVHGRLVREEQVVEITEPIAFIQTGIIVFKETLCRFSNPESIPWIQQLRRAEGLFIQTSEAEAFVMRMTEMERGIPDIHLPESFQWKVVKEKPTPKISFISEGSNGGSPEITGYLSFLYGTSRSKKDAEASIFLDKAKKLIYIRDDAFEKVARDKLATLGLEPSRYFTGPNDEYRVPPRFFVPAVQDLLKSGWRVESERVSVRNLGEVRIEVTSGIDWFDLKFIEEGSRSKTDMPQILEALKKGDSFVELGDGSRAILPEEWLKRFESLAKLGEIDGGKLRFKASQAFLLETLLESQTGKVTKDAVFKKLTDKLADFEKVRAKKELSTFKGKLRDYQRKGLGWLSYLENLGLSGCLADDMGLGKTIQVLALLQSRKDAQHPTLIVAPKSLVFNWISESQKFTPSLKVIEYTGGSRKEVLSQFAEADLIVTTYGSVRTDILELAKLQFDYVILDESQTIKNSSSQIAKAVRLLKGEHRLVLTGTPIENHVGELWSQFEFLNPGMLGPEQSFKRISESTDSQAALTTMSRALEPFILRRTKEQVLKELPPKTEQLLYCEFEEDERKKYDELREYYRVRLNERLEKFGANKSQIQILEALLRMRQASCDFRLVNPEVESLPGPKVRALLTQLEDILASGHKALIFSQFTSFLSIVKGHLDHAKIKYEYLDGATTDRKERVQRFQEEKDCPIFLLSLKAGGVGLNLTAADYVFVLDPWWNPAAEAQAIDRAHRIGQKHPVMVYRLIVKDTIEEKVLELQKKKKALSQAVLSNEKSVIRAITPEDINTLFSA